MDETVAVPFLELCQNVVDEGYEFYSHHIYVDGELHYRFMIQDATLEEHVVFFDSKTGIEEAANAAYACWLSSIQERTSDEEHG